MKKQILIAKEAWESGGKEYYMKRNISSLTYVPEQDTYLVTIEVNENQYACSTEYNSVCSCNPSQDGISGYSPKENYEQKFNKIMNKIKKDTKMYKPTKEEVKTQESELFDSSKKLKI
jgi:hypothetical protein